MPKTGQKYQDKRGKVVEVLKVKEDQNTTWIYTSLGAYGMSAFNDKFELIGEK